MLDDNNANEQTMDMFEDEQPEEVAGEEDVFEGKLSEGEDSAQGETTEPTETSEEQAIEPVANNDIVPQGDDIPEWMKDSQFIKEYQESNIGSGMDLDPEDLGTPRLKIVQAQTEDKMGAEIGDVINTMTGQNYGKEFEIVPLLMFKSRALFNADRTAKCMSRDTVTSSFGDEENKKCSECDSAKWTDRKNPPECNLTYNYGVVIAEDLQKNNVNPAVFSFMKAGVATAKQINAQLFSLANQGKPIFSRKVKIRLKEKRFERGSAWIAEASIGGYVADDEARKLFVLASKYKEMQDNVVPVHEEPTE
jgi:hypothetical protein